MKKSLLLWSIYFFTTPTIAELPQIHIDNFRGEFSSPSGRGLANRFDLPAPEKNAEILIEKTENGYTLATSDNLYEWSDVPSTLLDLYQASWSAINLRSQPQRFETSAAQITLNSEKENLLLRNLSLDCRLTNRAHPEFTQTLLEACLNGQGSAKLRLFQKVDKSLNSSSLFTDLLMAVTPYEIAPQSDTTIDNVDIKINRQAIEASLTTKVVFNTTIKLNGMIYYENDQKRIRLRIDRARAGILNVLSQIFEQLEKNQSETLIVQRPWVTIILEE